MCRTLGGTTVYESNNGELFVYNKRDERKYLRKEEEKYVERFKAKAPAPNPLPRGTSADEKVG
jgi:hypothetical protein